MSFFNKKEDVIHIELTPHGRHLLSLGKLKPNYYKFFDDDILYNSQHCDGEGLSENQNSSHVRITSETPKIKSNGNLIGVETKFNESKGDLLKGNEVGKELNVFKKIHDQEVNLLPYSIGTFKLDQTSSPSLSVDLFKGELSETTNKFLENNQDPILNIPQIEIEVEWNYNVKNPNDASLISSINNLKDPYKTQEINNLVACIFPEIPIIRTKHIGSLDHKENFSITSYLCEDKDDKTFYKKLRRQKKVNYLKDGLLNITNEDSSNIVDSEDYGDLTPDDLEFYFDIINDRLIADEDLCETVGQLEIKNIYLDEELNCPEGDQNDLTLNPYSSRVTIEDLKGEC